MTLIESLGSSHDDLMHARELFAAYPFKQAQRLAQRLDGGRLNAFYEQGLQTALVAGQPHWIARGMSGEPLAIAGLGGESWQSGVYGLKMARLQQWLNTVSPNEAGYALLSAAEKSARSEGIEHLSVRLDGADFANLHLFEAHGWRLVDVSLKLTRNLEDGGVHAEVKHGSVKHDAQWRIDAASSEDAPWIRSLATQGHKGTHYFNDPELPHETTRELFARWTERCLGGLAWRVYTLREAPTNGEANCTNAAAGSGAGAGFVIYLRANRFAEAVGRRPLILDFVVIDPARRGAGLGPWFISETLRRAVDEARAVGEPFDYCELRTSAHNLQAVMNYEKIGFRTCASDFVLHKRL